MIRKDKHPVTALLLGVAAIEFLVGGLQWSIHGIFFQWYDWLFMLSALVYVVLAVSARWRPATSAITGFVLYAAYVMVQACQSIELQNGVWRINFGLSYVSMLRIASIIVLLTIAIVCAFTRCGEELRREAAATRDQESSG